jgi:hypothetical protein
MFKAIKEFFVGKPAEPVKEECPYKVETTPEAKVEQPPVVETAPAVALPIEEPKPKPAKKPQGKKPAAGGAKKGGRKPKAKTSTAE